MAVSQGYRPCSGPMPLRVRFKCRRSPELPLMVGSSALARVAVSPVGDSCGGCLVACSRRPIRDLNRAVLGGGQPGRVERSGGPATLTADSRGVDRIESRRCGGGANSGLAGNGKAGMIRNTTMAGDRVAPRAVSPTGPTDGVHLRLRSFEFRQLGAVP